MSRMPFIRSLLIILGIGLLLLLSSSTTLADDPEPFRFDIYEAHMITVKFNEDTRIRLRDGELVDLDGLALQDEQSRAALAAVADGNWRRTHKYVSEEALDRLRIRGEARSGRDLPDLNLYFRLTLPEGLTAPEAIALFEKSPAVEAALPVHKPVDNPLPPDYQDPGDPGDPYQGYLDSAAEGGIDVRYAWQGSGGTGEGVRICDVERGINFDHADLPDVTLVTSALDSRVAQNSIDHGTAVVGQMGALNNGWGTTGMAYDAEFFFAAAWNVTDGYDIAAAITACAAALEAGDVILIEQQIAGPNRPPNPPQGDQTGLVPVEWAQANYDAIETAVADGIIVIQAAGNGAEDLDDADYNTGHAPFLPANDSGAIIVGAGAPPDEPGFDARERLGFSNFGSTVDVQGWGRQIVTLGYGGLYNSEGEDLWYTDTFGGTSGASPIVASAAAILQSTYRLANSGDSLTPEAMRTLLRNTGQPQVGTENIGPLPDLKAAIEDIWNITPPAPPVIVPASGVYDMPIQARIEYGPGQSGDNTAIRYTLNGSEPTEDSFIYYPEFGDVIYLNYGVTLKARSFQFNSAAGRRFVSDSAEATYISSTPKVETPDISTSGNFGVCNQPCTVTISTSTPGATIRYRTDGRTPSFFYPGTVYNGPFQLAPNETYEIVARGYKDGYYKSDAAYSGEFVVNELVLPPPTIYPGGGDFAGEVTVYMGSTVLGAEIHYTTDGSDPTTGSPLFVEPFVLTETATVKAIAHLDGYTDSPATTEQFNITQQVSAPTFDPVSGSTGTDSLQVELSTTTPNATIRYTTNGAEPTSYSTAYDGNPINLDVGFHTVKAKAFLAGAAPSETSTAEYTVYSSQAQVEAPIFSPGGGNFTEGVTVTISSATEDAVIRYTTDGSIPTAASTIYNAPIYLPASDTVYIYRAKAFKTGFTESDFTPATFQVFTPTLTATTPTIEPAGGVFTNTLQVTVAVERNPPFNVPQLYYTTDGTDPVVPYNVSGPTPRTLNLDEGTTVKAIGAQLGRYNSPVISETYEFVCDTPVISPSGGIYTEMVSVTMSSGTSNADIYYTLDGTEPDETSMIYTDTIALSVGEYPLKAKCFFGAFEPSETVLSALVVAAEAITPSIVTQPLSQTVQATQPVTFTLSATGTEALVYSWRKDGIILAGEDEPELLIPAARLADAGDYVGYVENEAGVVSSTVAALTVAPLTTTLSLAKMASAEVLTAGQRLTYTLYLTNSSPLTVEAVVVDYLSPLDAVAAITATGASVDLAQGVLTWTISTFTPTTRMFSYQIEVQSGFSGTLTNTAAITAGGDVVNVSLDYRAGTSVTITTTETITDPVDPGDTISPTVVSVVPIDGSRDVALTQTLQVEFSEAMSTSTVVVDLQPSTGLIGSWSQGNTRLNLSTIGLGPATRYTATVQSGADLAGNPLTNAPYTWVFTTAVDTSDTVSPTVLSVTPMDGTDNVALNQPLEVRFSETMSTTSVSLAISPSVSLSQTWTQGDRHLNLRHDGLAQGTRYEVSVLGAQDLAGNALADAPYTWVFTTGTIALPEADLSLAKTAATNLITAGQTIVYSFTVRNLGPTAPVSATLIDTFNTSAALAAVSGSSCSWVPGSVEVTCALSNLLTDTATVLTYSVTTPGDFTGNLQNNAEVDPLGNYIDPDMSNNDAGPVVVAVQLTPTTVITPPIDMTGTVVITVPTGGAQITPQPGVTITVPADAFTSTVVVSFTIIGTPGGTFGTLGNIGYFFELKFLDSATGQPVQPTKPYTLTVTYDPANILGGIAETDLALYVFDEQLGQWVREATSQVDPAANTITATPDHASLWAILFVEPDDPEPEPDKVYLPLVVK